ncbi:hypothetical protein PTTG_05561 [Puccinia triticina 1-1 BBBD Race 1]|uniref:Uncharacterized protein n=2 Tax=Puccinia triticina TaxID=208348 RepID=A0A0C4EXL2_PUCT1|nr:hypothetical protein PTTG_05561 [Puccinia triticina 1-1 BBBD Race 1]
MSRKRSKSDFGSSSHRPGSSDQPSHEKFRSVIPGGKTQGFGSSSSLAHLNAARSTRQRARTPDLHTPALLIRQKQRLAEASTDFLVRRNGSNSSPYPQYNNAAVRSSTSLKSSASVASIGTLYPSRSRAHSQLNTIPSEQQEEDHQLGPVRRTYLGGVGVYLNNSQDEDDHSQDEDESPQTSSVGHSRLKPNLTINVGLCKNGPELSKNTSNWYNRLLLSPLSSAGSSVYSFIMNSASPLVTSNSDDPEEVHERDDGASEKDSITKAAPSRKQSFRRHK